MNIDEIWLNYQIELKRFLHAKISNAADVDDLLQEILLKTYQNLDSLKDKTSIKAWLFQIAKNIINDFYRRKYRDTEMTIEDIFPIEDANDTQEKLLNCLIPFIKALPKEQAELLQAIDIDHVSQKEYAQEKGVSYSTLKSRVQKSRQLLKGLFDECCHFELDGSGRVYDYEQKERSKHQKP